MLAHAGFSSNDGLEVVICGDGRRDAVYIGLLFFSPLQSNLSKLVDPFPNWEGQVHALERGDQQEKEKCEGR